MKQEPKYHADQRVEITSDDDQFVGYHGTVKEVKRHMYPKRIGYLVAIDGTIHELWYVEWEIAAAE